VGDDDAQQSDDDIVDADQTFCQRLCSVISNKTYLLVVLSVSFLYYIITGIQYWVSDYMIIVLQQSEATVFICFGVVSITGPVLGVIIGGNITTYLGGYSTRKSLQQTLCFTCLCLVFALPAPFIDNFPLFCSLLWFLLFFGGAILPSLTGVLLNTVK
jgi:sugar phosphate permease